MKDLYFIYNPNSGRGKIKEHIEPIVKVFNEEGFNVTTYATKGPKDATIQVKENAIKYDRVVCSGGDGTLSEVVSGMMQLPKEQRVPIGFIPTGSTNDTSKSYNLPLDYIEGAKIAATGKIFATDVGIFNKDQYITYVASFGNLSAVSCFTPQELKKQFGHLAYIGEGIKVLFNLDSYDMTINLIDEDGNEEELKGNYFLGMATNSLSVGGFKDITGGNVILDDGYYEMAVLNKPENLIDFATQVDTLLLKKDTDESNDVVHKIKIKKVKFTTDKDLQWVIDGEDAGKHRVVEIEVEKQAVDIIIQA